MTSTKSLMFSLKKAMQVFNITDCLNCLINNFTQPLLILFSSIGRCLSIERRKFNLYHKHVLLNILITTYSSGKKIKLATIYVRPYAHTFRQLNNT